MKLLDRVSDGSCRHQCTQYNLWDSGSLQNGDRAYEQESTYGSSDDSIPVEFTECS